MDIFLQPRQWRSWTIQTAIFAASGGGAFLLRFDLRMPDGYLHQFWFALPLWILVKTLVFRGMNLDRSWWRFVGTSDLLHLLAGNCVGSALCLGLIALSGPAGMPRSIYFLDGMLCFLLTSSVRLLVRSLADRSSRPIRKDREKNALIYGGGEAGVSLLREILHNEKLTYNILGFLDDKPEMKRARIMNVPIFGGGDVARSVVKKYQIDTILVAIPSATGTQMARILDICSSAGVECKTVPGLAEVIEGRALVGQMREVAVEGLLGRKPVHLEEGSIREELEGRVVLVTGAAGSIGSELCRQIARFKPAGIVGFDIAESPLFEIDREMCQSYPEVDFFPEIGSIQNRARLEEVMKRYAPSIVYHAAAYKHVPLMEAHVFEAIENNVFGTYNLALAAAENGVKDFVMISSDKAVCPTNVMGTTKRVAELLLQALEDDRIKYVAVRFGNVLGSNGSVIPIFKKQIAAGGPVTVTHPEMRRFFMTIPEACQLVLQAGVIGKAGEICVLDMGEPVRIVDLARKLILLSGLSPGKEIKIEFTGMRPGEKLYEELSSLLENTVPSAHAKIHIFVGSNYPMARAHEWLHSVREICQHRDVGRLMVKLKEFVPEYNPSIQLMRRAITPHAQHPSALHRPAAQFNESDTGMEAKEQIA